MMVASSDCAAVATELAMAECVEPTIQEMLADPIVRALMAADGVDPEEFETLLRSMSDLTCRNTIKVDAFATERKETYAAGHSD
jgi:hypothetical protein